MNRGYDIILVDYPWSYKVYKLDPNSKGRAAAAHYTVDDGGLDSLEVWRLANDNSAMFFWAAWPHMFDPACSPASVVGGWNKTAKTKKNRYSFRTLAFEWVKLNKHWAKRIPEAWQHGLGGNCQRMIDIFLKIGLGFYARANPEPCLLYVTGSMPVPPARRQINLVFAPIGEHSQKPEAAYQRIEAMYPLSLFPRRIELFASKYSIPLAHKYGYEPVGFDVDGRDIREAIKDHYYR